MPSPATTHWHFAQNNGHRVGLPHNGTRRRPSGVSACSQDDHGCT
ncbi:hypothetical protein [Deinococcus humi]|uniref:Uncharacterized protein n=1 Tax=Deinococcus humi TaxID=662880 RepID=A0A7W8JTT7_9DEIO|nr:hypothetical protein [Deinococcus humi]MBB5362830.1 hypothetical protein [Deinococcus humi]